MAASADGGNALAATDRSAPVGAGDGNSTVTARHQHVTVGSAVRYPAVTGHSNPKGTDISNAAVVGQRQPDRHGGAVGAVLDHGFNGAASITPIEHRAAVIRAKRVFRH
jgi:hypothetical protein